MTHRRLRLLLAAAAVLVGMSAARGASTATPAHALSSGSSLEQKKGFDACILPSTTQMAAWWAHSSYRWYNVYIGGVNLGCNGATVTASWLNTVHAQGWNFLFTWVGLQAPGTGYSAVFSTNPSTAYDQGSNEAQAAVNTLAGNDGVASRASQTPVVFDLEASPAAYQSATNAFIQGWVNYLGTGSVVQIPGVYGSVCGSSLQSLAGLHPPPTFIWGAFWDGNPSTRDLYAGGCGVDSSSWIYSQRFKQYSGGHNETHGGVTLNIDNDCANGPTAPSGKSSATSVCVKS